MEEINLTGINMSNYITQSYGRAEINATGIIRDVCKFKEDYITKGNAYYMMLLTLITIGLLLINKILSKIYHVKDTKKYWGINKKGFYFKWSKLKSKLMLLSNNSYYINLIELLFPQDIEYFAAWARKILLLVLIFRTVFVYFAYYDFFPFTSIGGF